MRQELYRRARGICSAGSGLEFPGDQAKMRDKGKTGGRAADNAFFLQDFLFLILLVQRDRRLPACGGNPEAGRNAYKKTAGNTGCGGEGETVRISRDGGSGGFWSGF